MQPNVPQNSDSNDSYESPDMPAGGPSPQQAITPSAPPVSQPQAQSTPQPPKDNHKILNDYGSPAFPTPFPAVEGPAKKSRKKLIIILLAILLLLLGGSAAAYFGYVVPNKPENLWRSALANTGKGYDKLVEYTDNTNKVKDWTQNGSFKIGGDVAADGTFEGKTSGDTGQLTGSVSAAGLKMGFDVRTLPSANSTPDVYVKADGLQGIGSLLGGSDPQMATALNGINNQWYVIDHTLFDQLGTSTDKMSFTSDDVSAFIKTAGATTKKYIFTNDSNQSLVTLKEKVGKEKRDGQSVYHYKVGLDKTRTKAYLTALCNDLKKSKLGKSFGEDAYNCTEFAKDANDIKESDTADAWVSTKTRLVQAIRITETDNKANYFEISQNYTGGNTMPFKILYAFNDKNEKLLATINASLNTKTNSMKFYTTFTGSQSDSKYDGSFKLVVIPSKEDIKVEKPAGAKTIIELANDLGFGELLSGASAPGSSSTGIANQINAHLSAPNSAPMKLFLDTEPAATRTGNRV